MVKESIAPSQLNTCSSAERMPLEYAQYMADVLVLFFSLIWSWKRSPRAYTLSGFNLASYAIFDFIRYLLHVRIIYWPGSERWDNLRICISPCRLRLVPLWISKMSSWLCLCALHLEQRECTLPDLKTLILKAHHWPCVSWYNCFPEHWNDTVIYGGFLPACFCYVIGIQLS